MAEIQKLRELAAWYREFADRAGNPVIWDLRLRTAEDLEVKANRKGHRATSLAHGLRLQAQRLIATAHSIPDIEVKRGFASRALGLSVRAEAITNAIENPEIIPPNIRRYQSRLSAEICDEVEKKVVEEMLIDAGQLLDSLGARVL
jgi:hypothetical protein